MTLGSLVENFNNAYGERCAGGLLRLAARARLIMFRGRSRNLSSRGKAKASNQDHPIHSQSQRLYSFRLSPKYGQSIGLISRKRERLG